jgi:hypothetical protein
VWLLRLSMQVVREGKIPCQKIGRHWCFRKPAIAEWLEHASLDRTDDGTAKDRGV